MVDQGRLREISWQELFPWVRIVSALRLAISPSLLALAAFGLLAMYAGWRFLGWAYSGSDNPQVQAIVRNVQTSPWEGPLLRRDIPDEARDIRASPFFIAWDTLSERFREMFASQTFTVLPFTLMFLLALWALIVWSLFGAAITRVAAVALARGDRLGFRAGLAHGIRRWPLYFGAPAIPLVGAFVIAIPLMVLGLLMRLDFFVFLGGIIWPLALLAGFILALLLVGLAVGWPLMWATISVEATDPFDALSRSYSYAFHRPIRYLFYVIIAAILGALGWYVVALFYDWILQLTYWGLSWGSTSERAGQIANEAESMMGPAGSTADWNMFHIGGSIIGFWQGCLKMLALGFLFSYFWSAATAIYYLLRKDEDGTELTEVTYEDQGEARGLPPLVRDALGVPAVSDAPASTPIPPSAATEPPLSS